MDKTKKKKKKGSSFLGVRQRPSKRWVAEIKVSSQNLRLWLGTYDKAEEAAEAYDFAARILRGRNAKTNFPMPDEAMYKMPLRNPRLYELIHNEELSTCTTVHETVVCSSEGNKRQELVSGVSLGGSRVYPSVVVAPSFN